MLQTYEHEQFLYWQQERENIRIKKEAGEPRPWTYDKILDTYRFCNVRREDDTVTKWINDNIRVPYADYYLLPLMLGIARWINLPSTLGFLMTTRAWPTSNDWSPEFFYEALRMRRNQGAKIYNPAYVISPCGTTDKNKFVTDTLTPFYMNIRDFPRTSLEDAFLWLNDFHGWGQFMTYQTIIDIRHTPILNKAPDVHSFAAFGPGTRRGINRLHGHPLTTNLPKSVLKEAVAELQFHNALHLEASDICNCLCEYDKYARVFYGQGKPKQLYRG